MTAFEVFPAYLCKCVTVVISLSANVKLQYLNVCIVFLFVLKSDSLFSIICESCFFVRKA